MSDERPHSAEHFGRQRAFWWRPDYLGQLGSRVGNDRARTLLDVGTGRCHWAAIVTRWFPGLTEMTGVDIEPAWVSGAPEALAGHLGHVPFATRFVLGSALDLPCENDSFDVVTCQTVLMYLADPGRAVREMLRVLKPGGTIIVAEPASFRAMVELDTAMLALGFEGMMRRQRLWLACHLGRMALGRGDFNVGERLMPLLRAAGARAVEVVMNDKARPIAAPYDDEMQALMEFLDGWAAQLHGSDRERTLELAVAGGLTRDEAEALVAHERRWDALRRAQYAKGEFAAGGASHQFVAWGRRAAEGAV